MIRLDIKHKTEEIGASFDTDYRVITQCIPDCPACAAQDQLRMVLEYIIKHGSVSQYGDLLLPKYYVKKLICREAEEVKDDKADG